RGRNVAEGAAVHRIDLTGTGRKLDMSRETRDLTIRSEIIESLNFRQVRHRPERQLKSHLVDVLEMASSLAAQFIYLVGDINWVGAVQGHHQADPVGR